MKLFFDTEFTGLHKNTTLISIGIVSEDGRTFYCELNDYNESQVNDWILENVIAKLKFKRPAKDADEPFAAIRHESNPVPNNLYNGYSIEFRGNMDDLRNELKRWLSQFKETCYFWSDCLAYDWVLFCNIFFDSLPFDVYYIPFDICTLFEVAGIDPDISRERFAGVENGAMKHNALFDAKIIMECYIRLTHFVRYGGWINGKTKIDSLLSGKIDGSAVYKGEIHLNAQTVEYDLNHIKIVKRHRKVMR